MQVVTNGVTNLSIASSNSSLVGDVIRKDQRSKWQRLDTPVTLRTQDVVISWTCQVDEKRVARVEVKSPGRRTRHRGWECLRVHQAINDFRAYRLLEGADTTIIIYRMRDTANFFRRITDETSLGEITLPGTHESCALYGFPVSQCQQPSTPVMRQLLDGVRFLDVRLRVVGDELLMFHGPRPQRSNLPILLATLHTFLTAHPSETLILCLKEESPPFHPRFSALVYQAFKPFLFEWFLEERIPTLGEVRGKGILLTRFDKQGEGEWEEGMGIHPSTWPDSMKEGFEWVCDGTKVRTQDWYRVKTFLEIPEKFEAVIDHLRPTTTPSTEAPQPFTLSYTSASYFPLSLPTIIAKGFGWPEWGLGVYGVNSRFMPWLLGRIACGQRIRGCVVMDFYQQTGDRRGGGEGLAELLVMMNFLD